MTIFWTYLQLFSSTSLLVQCLHALLEHVVEGGEATIATPKCLHDIFLVLTEIPSCPRPPLVVEASDNLGPRTPQSSSPQNTVLPTTSVQCVNFVAYSFLQELLLDINESGRKISQFFAHPF